MAITKNIDLNSQSDSPIPSDNCCLALSTVFSLSFVNVAPTSVPDLPVYNYDTMEPVYIDWMGIRKLIQNLKASSSPGDDGIHPKFLKKH